MHSNIAGSLKIATIPTLFNKIIPKALSTFKKDYPHIEVEVIESDRDKIMKMVEDNEVDIGLIGKTESETFGQTIVSNSLNISTNFRLIVPKNLNYHYKIQLKWKLFNNIHLYYMTAIFIIIILSNLKMKMVR